MQVADREEPGSNPQAAGKAVLHDSDLLLMIPLRFCVHLSSIDAVKMSKSTGDKRFADQYPVAGSCKIARVGQSGRP
jgi:hypothetical protein